MSLTTTRLWAFAFLVSFLVVSDSASALDPELFFVDRGSKIEAQIVYEAPFVAALILAPKGDSTFARASVVPILETNRVGDLWYGKFSYEQGSRRVPIIVQGFAGLYDPTSFAPLGVTSLSTYDDTQEAVRIGGDLERFHKVTLTFDGPQSSEDAAINPFSDIRFDVTFTDLHSLEIYRVPGYFAADGNAADTLQSAQHIPSQGDKWRVHFAPRQIGCYRYDVHFREGAAGSFIATNSNLSLGTPGVLDGREGGFCIEESEKSLPDLRAKERGPLVKMAGDHFLRYYSGALVTGFGAGSPENFLNHPDIDNRFDSRYTKGFDAHASLVQQDDPTWRGNGGAGLFGAFRYLRDQGGNFMYVLLHSVFGDDKAINIFLEENEYFRVDVSKAEQISRVLEGAAKYGINLLLLDHERENGNRFGVSGDQRRKFFYRILTALFGHLNGHMTILGEEITFSGSDVVEFAKARRAWDPYGDKVLAVHTWPHEPEMSNKYRDILDHPDRGAIDVFSLQSLYPWMVNEQTVRWLNASQAAGSPMVVFQAETGYYTDGFLPDSSTADDHRTQVMHAALGTLFAGGPILTTYFGYQHSDNDLNCDQFNTRAVLWSELQSVFSLWYELAPIETGRACNEFIRNLDRGRARFCFGDGEVILFFAEGSTSLEVDLPVGDYSVRRFRPLVDRSQLNSSSVQGGGVVNLSSSAPDTLFVLERQ